MPNRIRLIVGLIDLSITVLASQSAQVSAEGTTMKAVPTVEILLPGNGPFAMARDLCLTIKFGNVPSGAGLVINAIPESQEIAPKMYFGNSPIMLKPLPIGGTGQIQYIWPRQRIGWSPLDAPAWNDPIDIGRYRLFARVLSRDSFAILGEVVSSFPTTKDVLADFTSPIFGIVEGP